VCYGSPDSNQQPPLEEQLQVVTGDRNLQAPKAASVLNAEDTPEIVDDPMSILAHVQLAKTPRKFHIHCIYY
jgi:hypothetical protein